MEVHVVALAARMTCWAVGGRRSHPFVSFSTLHWAATTGRSASSICSRVTTLVSMRVRPRWSCGAGVDSFGRFASVRRWNQTCARLSARREGGATRTRGDFMATACKNAKTLLQLSAIVANVLATTVSAEACFAIPVVLASTASIVTTILSSLASLALLEESASDAHSVMERAKIFRSLPASDSPWRIAASVKNGGRRTALWEVLSLCFFDHTRSPAAARRRTSTIRRRIFLLAAEKAISMLNKITEGELRLPARAKSTKDSPSDLFATAASPNVNWISPGVELFVGIVRLENPFRLS